MTAVWVMRLGPSREIQGLWAEQSHTHRKIESLYFLNKVFPQKSSKVLTK